MAGTKIQFERSGGFANIPMRGEFNLDDLPPDQAQNIHTLLEQADFNSLPDDLAGGSHIPDQFTYTVTVEGAAGKKTVVTGDRSAPENLRPLLQTLTELARKKR